MPWRGPKRSWRVRRSTVLLPVALVAGWLGCRGHDAKEEPHPAPTPVRSADASPNPRPEIVEMLREDLAATRHPGDGGGRVWLDPIPTAGAAATPGTWRLVYEAGPLGIDVGGWLFLQVPPFWGWDSPQTRDPNRPGFTTVEVVGDGVTVDADRVDAGLLGIRVAGRKLESGERVVVVYGQGPLGARRDRYAEHRSQFYVSVDADGDGVRGLVDTLPDVDVAAGPPARLMLTLPSTARPGASVRGRLAVLDAVGNAGVDFEGVLEVRSLGGGEPLQRIDMQFSDGGVRSLEIELSSNPIQRFEVVGPKGLRGESNPVSTSTGPRILWGDLHGHSQLSDGTGTPDDYFTYARDVAALDVVALTDHDHWGMKPLSHHPELWDEIESATARFHRPGEFVTLLGYEWTSWIHGHRHVLYFEDEGEVLSSIDPRYESPLQLWDALRGQRVLTFAHHSAGGPIATNWGIPPDPELEPVTEIASVHGSSESPDTPRGIYAPMADNWVRDALGLGYRLGFVGSGDSHDGHPGLAQLAGGTGGLAAILSEDASREGVLEALRSRRVYATNGPRIILRVALDGAPMGSVLAARDRGMLALRVITVAPLDRIDIVRGQEIASTIGGEGRMDFEADVTLPDLQDGESIYVRVVQLDGGAAWSSPFFVGESPSGPETRPGAQ